MGLDRPEDVDQILRDLDMSGVLDNDEHASDKLLTVHRALRQCGANPESADSYRAILAVAAMLAQFSPFEWGQVLQEVITVSFRALRDLSRRGGT